MEKKYNSKKELKKLKKFFQDNMVSIDEGVKNGFRAKLKLPEDFPKEKADEMRKGIMGSYFDL